jgi:hypothetical protein
MRLTLGATAQSRHRLEEEEALFKAKAMNEVDAERDRATPHRRQDTLIHSSVSYEEEDTCMSNDVDAESDRATPA